MTTSQKKRKGKTREAAASHEALQLLKKEQSKNVKERLAILKALRGSLSHLHYSVDDYLADKKKERELEDR